eukprot:1810006-Prymnesium_polylepis.4
MSRVSQTSTGTLPSGRAKYCSCPTSWHMLRCAPSRKIQHASREARQRARQLSGGGADRRPWSPGARLPTRARRAGARGSPVSGRFVCYVTALVLQVPKRI